MTPGQLVYEAFADQFPGETWGPWENVSALPMGERHGWEKVAQALLDDAFPGLREQVRLAREDRDQLRKQVLDFAGEIEDEAERNDCACEAKTGNAAAARLRKIAEPPS